MSKSVSPAVLTLLAVVLAGTGLFFAFQPGRGPVAPERPRADIIASAPAPAAPAAPATPIRPRRGRHVGVDDAIRELDLIRPSRPKLAEDFTARMADGTSFRLSEHRGKVVFINFWATWCPPCREEMPAMERLFRQQKENGFVMVAVALDADPAVVPPFVARHGFTFPVVLDPAMDVANAYGVRAVPSSFIVDRQGNLAALALGPRAWDNDASQSLVEGMVR